MNHQVPLPGFELHAEPAQDPKQLHSLYFMLMPPETAQRQVMQIRRELQAELVLRGSFIEPARLHLSLLALGHCAGEPPPLALQALRHAAACTHAEAVSLMLDRAVSFQRAFVLVSSQSNPQINRLRAALRNSLRKVGWEGSSNTRAHVTLSYESQRHPERAVAPVRWRATSFCLIDSLYGRHEHRKLGEWPLFSAS